MWLIWIVYTVLKSEVTVYGTRRQNTLDSTHYPFILVWSQSYITSTIINNLWNTLTWLAYDDEEYWPFCRPEQSTAISFFFLSCILYRLKAVAARLTSVFLFFFYMLVYRCWRVYMSILHWHVFCLLLLTERMCRLNTLYTQV